MALSTAVANSGAAATPLRAVKRPRHAQLQQSALRQRVHDASPLTSNDASRIQSSSAVAPTKAALAKAALTL